MGKIKGKEFIHSYHLPEIKDRKGNIIRKDTLIVKEKIHYEDGRIIPNLNIIEEYKRPFWITKGIYRNHKQKKEWEYKERLDKFMATDSELPNMIMEKLGKKRFGKVSYREAIRSPYVYGSDVESGVLLKEEYIQKWGIRTPLTVTYYDIEAHPITKEISIVSSSRKIEGGKIEIFVIINRGSINKSIKDIEKEVKYTLLENLPDSLPNGYKADDLKFIFKVVHNDGKLLKEFWKKMHQDKSDIVTSWGVYDIETMVSRLKSYGLDPKDILSDPNIPYELRDWYVKKDKAEFITQSGKRTSRSFEKQWHLFRSPAHFYILDMMATYYFNRRGSKEVPGGYGLQNILERELNYGKLKFEDVTNLTDTEWHIYMLKYEPIKYFAYNIWDQLGMLFLNEKTTDIDISLPTLSERSLWESYGMMGKPILDDFHFYALENGVVLGTKVNDEKFDGGLGRDDWPVTVHPWKRVPTDESNRVFKEGLLPNNQGLLVSDLDVESSYPSCTVVSRLSKQTTVREINSIDGVDITTIKRNVSNLLTGDISHMGVMRNLFNAPTHLEFYQTYQKLKESGEL